MNVAGVIAEYNPFHNGHKYHIEQAKKITGAEFAAVVLSGNFTQRGEPAIFDKYLRTYAALLNGADLVLELPAFFSTASAGFFAKGAVDILNASGIVNSLCFGAESDDIAGLAQTADILIENGREILRRVKHGVKNGLSFPRARAEAVVGADFISARPESVAETNFTPPRFSYADSLNEPNNILAVEYIKALKTSHSEITPFCVKRKKARHNDTGVKSRFASGMALRAKILSGETDKIKRAVPKNVFSLYKNAKPHKTDNLSEIFQYKLKTAPDNALGGIFGFDEGLENRIIKCAGEYFTINKITDAAKTKRYTRAKLQRALLSLSLGITKSDFARFSALSPGYIRVLGFKKSSNLIGALCQKSLVPVIVNVKNAKKRLNAELFDFFEKELVFSDIYYLTNNIAKQNKNDYREKTIAV